MVSWASSPGFLEITMEMGLWNGILPARENLWFIEGQPEFSWGWDGRISCPLPAKWQCLTGSVLGWDVSIILNQNKFSTALCKKGRRLLKSHKSSIKAPEEVFFDFGAFPLVPQTPIPKGGPNGRQKFHPVCSRPNYRSIPPSICPPRRNQISRTMNTR